MIKIIITFQEPIWYVLQVKFWDHFFNYFVNFQTFLPKQNVKMSLTFPPQKRQNEECHNTVDSSLIILVESNAITITITNYSNDNEGELFNYIFITMSHSPCAPFKNLCNLEECEKKIEICGLNYLPWTKVIFNP